MNSVQHTNRAPTRWMSMVRAQLDVLWASVTGFIRPAGRAQSAPANPFPDRPRILVVDDSPVNQLLVAALLWRWGITPLVAADGAEAVALACGQDFDLILMDLQMPVLDGLTATRQLRRFELEHARPRAPVVAYTSRVGHSSGLYVTHRIPAAIKTTPAMSDTPTASPSVSAEIKMPRLGVARSAIDMVLAWKCRPASTTAQ